MKCPTTADTFFSRFLTTTLAAAGIAALLISASSPSVAAAYNSSKSGIKTLGVVDWGPPGFDVPSDSTFNSSNNVAMKVRFESQQAGKAVSTKGISGIGPSEPTHAGNGDEWDGNLYGDQNALWTNGAGAITLQFDQYVQAVGAAIQTNYFGDFTAEIDVFHDGNLLGSFLQNGNSNGLEDGSAIFMGVADDVKEIDTVRFSIVNCAQNCYDFAIDSLDLGVPNQVPEPGTLALLGSGVVGLGTMLRRRFHS